MSLAKEAGKAAIPPQFLSKLDTPGKKRARANKKLAGFADDLAGGLAREGAKKSRVGVIHKIGPAGKRQAEAREKHFLNKEVGKEISKRERAEKDKPKKKDAGPVVKLVDRKKKGDKNARNLGMAGGAAAAVIGTGLLARHIANKRREEQMPLYTGPPHN